MGDAPPHTTGPGLDAQGAASQLAAISIAVESRDLKAQSAPQNRTRIASNLSAPSHRIRNCLRILSQTSIRKEFPQRGRNIFAISFAKPFAFASEFLRNAESAAFCLRFGGENSLANSRGAPEFAFAFAALYRCDRGALSSKSVEKKRQNRNWYRNFFWSLRLEIASSGKSKWGLSKWGLKVLVHNCPRLPTIVVILWRKFPSERGPKRPQKCTIVHDCAQIAESGLKPPFESPHLDFPD